MTIKILKAMKTQIATIFAALVLSAGIAETTHAAPAAHDNAVVLNDVSSINKIEVYGNVKLYISSGRADQVKVYNKYYAESALVQDKSGSLRIASYKPEQLVVWVTVNDLRSVSAYDNAVVESFDKFSNIDFSLDLHNRATARMNVDAFDVNVKVSDDAKVNLSGSVTNYDMSYDNAENVNYTELQAIHTSKTPTGITAAVKASDDEFAWLANLK